MPQTGPDKNLATEQFAEMNHEFYQARPTEYLERRLVSLLLAVSAPDGVAEALREGISFGQIRFQRTISSEENSTELSDLEAYASIESTNLLHHAGECMLRLYFAHQNNPLCPWLEVSRLRAPSKFKDQVHQLYSRLKDNGATNAVTYVFFGNADPSKLGLDTDQKEWSRYIDGTAALLALTCRFILDDAALYNATKHGLALIGGTHGLELGSPDQTARISTHGPALQFLDIQADASGKHRRWVKNLQFVDAERNIALTKIILMHISSMWDIARYRYTDDRSSMPRVPSFTTEALAEMLTPITNDQPVGFSSMSQTLLYYADQHS